MTQSRGDEPDGKSFILFLFDIMAGGWVLIGGNTVFLYFVIDNSLGLITFLLAQ